MIFGSKIEGLLCAIAVGVAGGAITSVLAPMDARMPGICFQVGDIGVDAAPGIPGADPAPTPPQPNRIRAQPLPAPEMAILIPPPHTIDVVHLISAGPTENLRAAPPQKTLASPASDSSNESSNIVAQASHSVASSPPGTGAEKSAGSNGARGGSNAGVRGARPVASIFPAYPETSREKGEQGTVELSFVVLATGKTTDISLIRSSGFPHLDDAARQAVRRARFLPATHNGAPIPSKVLQPFKFQLE